MREVITQRYTEDPQTCLPAGRDSRRYFKEALAARVHRAVWRILSYYLTKLTKKSYYAGIHKVSNVELPVLQGLRV